MDYTHILGGVDAVASASIGRAGAKIVTADSFGRVRRVHDFTCVPSAYGNALRALGLPISADDCQAISDAALRFTSAGRLSRATGRAPADGRIKREVARIAKRRGGTLHGFTRLLGKAGTLARAVDILQKNRARAGVIWTRTPNHATALTLDEDQPVIIDNGGWDDKKRLGWRGKNVLGIVALIRADEPSRADIDALNWRELDAAANAAIRTHSAQEWARMRDRADAAKALAEQIGAV